MSDADLEVTEAAQAMYDRDGASQGLGMELLEAIPGRAQLRMTVRADMVNGLAVCHGGLIFTLADSAMAFATNAADQRAFASHADIDFLNPAPLGTVLTAVATQEVRRAKLGINNVTVTDHHGTPIALFRGRTITVGGGVKSPFPFPLSDRKERERERET